MAVSLRLAGHPLHPIAGAFPDRALDGDCGARRGGLVSWAARFVDGRFGSLAAGLAMALLAMIAGAARLRLDSETACRARHGGVAHAGHGHGVVAFRSQPGVSRLAASVPAPVWAIGFALAGFATMAVGGWLGGKLVYGFGIGMVSRS